MAVFYEVIPQTLIEWLLQQKVFWVATAPLSGSGHVNVSPKGGAYFGVIDEKTFWYMDLTGSGNETISHLHERGNGRITVMFNAFEGAPKILRLFGQGRVLENGTEDFENFVEEHNVETIPGSRSIIIVDVHQVGSSCGYSVPFYEFQKFRPTLNDHFAKIEAKHQRTGKVEDGMDHYWAYKNSYSVDGLPGMKRGLVAQKKYSVEPLKKFVGVISSPRNKDSLCIPVRNVVVIALVSLMIGLVMALYGPALVAHFGPGLKNSPLELKVGNLTHVSFEDLTGLWTAK